MQPLAATTHARRPIRTLPELLVNQIAAGEVVDRPASVVKELIENAIDAGASRITLELEQGGIELVRVTDDGAGIPAAELPLALAAHATSKIVAAEDLDRIGTMGFRGEALASIASVSRLVMRSRFRGDGGEGGVGQAPEASASEVEAEGDRISGARPASGPFGTCVSVRNLFFNTPARRKFLRTAATEQGHCLDVLTAIAIAHPAMAFTAACDGRAVFDVPPNQGPRDRVLGVLGKELEGQLIEVHADRFDDARGLALWGLVGLPSIARATIKSQYIFLNGRIIRDRTIQHALREAYRGLIEPGRYPTAVLMLEMDPGAVDVNVHPAKAEVRFRDQSLVHGVVLRAVRDGLRVADLTPGEGGAGAGAWGLRGQEESRQQAMFGAGRVQAETPVSSGPVVGPEQLVEFLRRPPVQVDTPSAEAPAPSSLEQQIDSTSEAPLVEPPRPRDPLLQVHNSYVVTQDENGLLIVDQHALHERVMFEALLARISAPQGSADSVGGTLESQRLLVPAPVKLTRSQMARLEELSGLLARIGVAVEPLGPEAVGVQAFPTFLLDRSVDPAEFVAELFERAEADGFAPASEAALHEVLDMMACKAAIKAGDRLSETELRDLLNFRGLVERSSNCPHGRPTSIRVTIKELEKRFGRV